VPQEADDLAGVKIDGDVIHGLDAAEGELDVAHLDERGHNPVLRR
jgi:hypothetical protein